jgi:hypothetical protein
VRTETLRRNASPAALLVGLEDELGDKCAALLAAMGIKSLRAGHVAAACERLPVVMPQLVLVPAVLLPQDEELLADRAVAVGAEVVRMDAEVVSTLEASLRAAGTRALARALENDS